MRPRWLGYRADLAALLLGMLSAGALPPVHAIPLLLIAIPGLLALIGAVAQPARPHHASASRNCRS
jgi:phosphoribosylcarboxyaminoimidazole (NCAIR) mutase